MIHSIEWPIIEFGSKHKGKTLPQAVLTDPAWFFASLKHQRFWASSYADVSELAYKACNIKIPKPDPENWKIIWTDSPAGNCDPFRIMGPEEPIVDFPFIMSHLDLAWPRRWLGYDFGVSEAVSAAFRKNVFGGAELTAERCNAFFSDDENFLLL